MHAPMIDRMLTFMPEKAVEGLTPAQRRRLAKYVLRMCAYHEAGHVALGYYLGTVKPAFVTIAEGERLGVAHTGERHECGAEATIIHLLAGHAADCRFRGARFRVGDALDTLDAPGVEPSSDLSKAMLLALNKTGNTERAIDLVCQCADRANDTVALPDVWPKIKCLAECLIEHGTVAADCGLIEALFGALWAAGRATP